MLIYLELFLSFFKIGIFGFGGGYVMIPLIQREIETYGWLTTSEFIDIIAVAEMTPGPIAVNSATFVGYKTAGIPGGLIATLGVALPSLLIILFFSRILLKYKEHVLKKTIFYMMRPVIVGLIVSAAILIAQSAFFEVLASFGDFVKNPFLHLNIGAVFIFIASLAAIIKLKINPIFTVIGSGVIGVIMFGLFI